MTAKPETRGRKAISVPRSAIERLRKERYTWEQIADQLNISRATAIRILHRPANTQPATQPEPLGDLIS